MLTASNIEPTALSAVTRKLEDVLDHKNNAIRTLEFELAKVTKVHRTCCGRCVRNADPARQSRNDAIRTYEAKLVEYGIPVEDLGFRPLITKTTSGPAGLVAD